MARRPPLLSIVWATIFCACMATGCSEGNPALEESKANPPSVNPEAAEGSATPSTPPRLVVLVSIDTLRADHLGTYGYERFTSPMLDAFATEGSLFVDASSAAPWTLPSHATMLTGLYPMSHGVMTWNTALDPNRRTLPAMLQESGYHTAAILSTGWLMRGRYKVTKDFEDYLFINKTPWRRSPSTVVTDQAIDWIRTSHDQKLFVMLHYFDVHGDYASEPEYEQLFVRPYEGPADGTSEQLLMSYLEPEYIEMCKKDFDPARCAFDKGSGESLGEQEFFRPEFDTRDIEHLIDLYDAGVRQMDAELGRLFAFLRKEGHLDDALIIITADHGEEFREHGRLDHFLSTHQEVLHVPLIMRGPGVPAGKRIESPVSLVDLVPTILELTGTPATDDLDGMSLVPLLKSGDDTPFRQRTLFGEAPGGLSYETMVPGIFPVIRSIRKDRWKLIYDSKRDEYELYDLSTDPLEQTDLAAQEPSIAALLGEEMRKRYEGFTPAHLENATVELSDEEIEELRSLGYVP